jgi:hypothetical protein
VSCQLCQAEHSRIVRTTYGADIRRVRQCGVCGHRWVTVEVEKDFIDQMRQLQLRISEECRRVGLVDFDDGDSDGGRVARWFAANWNTFHQSIDAIRSRVAAYEALGDGPAGPGVYFLFLGTELQYVGKSGSISRRLTQHAIARKIAWDGFAWIDVPADWGAGSRILLHPDSGAAMQ